MINQRKAFHSISYLQYPIMAIALYYAFKPYVVGFETVWENYNYMLIFMGLGISFSTLQDTSKTQNNFSRRIWQSAKKGRIALIFIAVLALFFIFIGLYGLYVSTNDILSELSFGTIVLGIGIVGMLKSAIEMFENHQVK